MANIMHVEVVLSENGHTESFVLDDPVGWTTVIIGEQAKTFADDHSLDTNLKFKPKANSGAALEMEAVALLTKEPDVCTWDGAKWVCSGS